MYFLLYCWVTPNASYYETFWEEYFLKISGILEDIKIIDLKNLISVCKSY